MKEVKDIYIKCDFRYSQNKSTITYVLHTLFV